MSLNAVRKVDRMSLFALLLGALTVMFGIQLVRTLLVGMAVYLTQVQKIDPVLVGLLGLAVFLCGFLAPVVRRALGFRYALPVVASLLTLVWFAEKFVSSLPADLGISIIGTVLFLWSLPLLFQFLRSSDKGDSPAHAVIALLLGISAETAVKGAFGTIDLSWAQGAGVYVAAVVLVAALGFFVWRFVSAKSQQRFQAHGSASGWPYLAIGPALALQFLVFQNVAHQTVFIGWPQPAVFAWVLTANLAGVVAAVELTRQRSGLPWPVLLLLGGLLIAMVAGESSGLSAAMTMLIGQVAMAVLLVSIVRPGPESTGDHSGRDVSVWTSAGMLFLLFLLSVYYATYRIDVLAPQEVFRSLAALLIGLAAVRAGFSHRGPGVPVSRIAGVAALVLLVLPLVLFVRWKDVTPSPGDGLPVRVMTYNLHQGFDVHGRHGLEDLARVIEAEDPDIVALQEVSRGWVVNGSVDMLVWLSQRLEMDYAWGPAVDPLWGNAVLSRLPIVSYQNHEMPNNDEVRADRAFLKVEIDVGGGETIDVVATHFHSGDEAEDSAIRIPQAAAVLEAVDVGRTTILLGDFNAHPDHPEMRLIADAGFNDALVASGANVTVLRSHRTPRGNELTTYGPVPT